MKSLRPTEFAFIKRKDGHHMYVLNAIKCEFLNPSLPQSFLYLENEIARGSTIVMIDSGSVGRGVRAGWWGLLHCFI